MTSKQTSHKDEMGTPMISVWGSSEQASDSNGGRLLALVRCRRFQWMRWILGTLAIVWALSLHAVASADADVPPGLQADLIGKIASFDRNLPARAGGTVRILVLHKNGDGRSTRVAKEVANSLNGLADIAGMGKEIRSQAFSSAAEVAAACKSQRLSIVYLAPGLESEMAGVAKALAGVDVMSVGPSGAVVGFVLEESKPRIVVNVARAKSQNVALKAQVLKLAKIVE